MFPCFLTSSDSSSPPTPRCYVQQTARRYQPQTSSTVEAAGPIKLEFGRPDIAAYLQRTFAMRTDPSCTEPEHDLETASVQAEVSFQAEGSRRNGGLPGRQVCGCDAAHSFLLKLGVRLKEMCVIFWDGDRHAKRGEHMRRQRRGGTPLTAVPGTCYGPLKTKHTSDGA